MTPKKILIIILAIVAGFTILSISSCSNKYYAKQCQKRFPITESVHDTITTIVGKVDTFMQVVTFDCDSAIKYSHDTTILTHTFKVPCPPSTHRVDTFYHSKTITEESSAKLFLANKTRDSLIAQCEKKDKKIAELTVTVSKQSRHILHLSLLLGSGVLLFGIGLVLKFKKI